MQYLTNSLDFSLKTLSVILLNQNCISLEFGFAKCYEFTLGKCYEKASGFRYDMIALSNHNYLFITHQFINSSLMALLVRELCAYPGIHDLQRQHSTHHTGA